jgi:hypothetical protein
MITTQKEKAFAAELKELMEKHGVRIEEDGTENHEEWIDDFDDSHEVTEIKTSYRFSGPDIDVAIEDFNIWLNISGEVKEAKSTVNIAQLRNSAA